MANKKLAVALCLGLVSNVAWCNMQTLVTPELAHIGGVVLGIGLATFCGSPIVNAIFKNTAEHTYFYKLTEKLRNNKEKTRKILVFEIATAVAGSIGGLVLIAHMVQ